MRKIRFIGLTIISFAVTLVATFFIPGKFINRLLSTFMCAIFSFNWGACSVNLAKNSGQVFAAFPPSLEKNIENWFTQRSGEFDDEPSPPASINNQQVPPFPVDPGPNIIRPEFDDAGSVSPSQPQPNQRFIITSDLREINPGLYETVLISSEGCKIIRKIRKTNQSFFYESIRYEVPDSNSCGGKSYVFNFSEDNNIITGETSLNENFKIKVNNPGYWDVNYTNASGEQWLLRIEPLANTSNQSKLNVSKKQSNFFIPIKTQQDNNFVIDHQNFTSIEKLSPFNSFNSHPSQNVSERLTHQKLTLFADEQWKDQFNTILISSGWSCIEAPLAKIGCDICQIAKKILALEDLAESTDTMLNTITPSIDQTMRIQGRKITDVINSASEPMITLEKAAIENQFLTKLKQTLKKGLNEALNCEGDSGSCSQFKRLEQECEDNRNKDKEPQPQPTPTPTPTSQPPQPRTPIPQRCNSCGDPHLTTMDGQKYDYQAVGEFVLTRTKNRQFEIQVRQAPFKNINTAAINVAAAMKVGDARVGIYATGFPDDQTKIPLRIDGKPVELKGTQNLAGGGSITHNGGTSWTVQWPTGEVATFEISGVGDSSLLNISTGVTENDRGQLEGLLGNFNGNTSDDFMTRDGRVIPQNQEAMETARSVLNNFNINRWIPIPIDPLTEAFLDTIHSQFGNSWRISQSESLFDYAPGKNTGTFTNPAFPNGFVILRMLAPDAVAKAEEACRVAEVPSDRLEGCLFDVAVTGETGFARVAANFLKNKVRQRVEGEIRNRIPIPVPLPF